MKSHPQFKPALLLLGERIRHSRFTKNLTTKQVAADLTITPEAYRNIEKGVTDISFTTLLQIALALETTGTDLIQDL